MTLRAARCAGSLSTERPQAVPEISYRNRDAQRENLGLPDNPSTGSTVNLVG